MLIYLQDLDTDEEVTAELTVESTVPCQDLYALFFSHSQSCGIPGGRSSAPFQEYQWQRVSHQVIASLSHGAQRYTLTLGFYLRGDRFIPFVLDQVCADLRRYGRRFGTAVEAYDHPGTHHVLFHYPALPSLLEGGRSLTFREAAAKALRDDDEPSKAYAFTKAERPNLDRLVSHAEFSEAMDRQAVEPQAS